MARRQGRAGAGGGDRGRGTGRSRQTGGDRRKGRGEAQGGRGTRAAAARKGRRARSREAVDDRKTGRVRSALGSDQPRTPSRGQARGPADARHLVQPDPVTDVAAREASLAAAATTGVDISHPLLARFFVPLPERRASIIPVPSSSRAKTT